MNDQAWRAEPGLSVSNASMSVTARGDAGPARFSGTPLSPTIFHEPWWMEIACDGDYQEATVAADGVVVARLPYKVLRKTLGVTVLGMPTMTHVLGPAIDESGGGSSLRRHVRNIGVTSQLLAQLPRCTHISFRLHGDITDTLAFDAAGFTNGVNFTVEIPPDSPDGLWRQMRDKTRNVIRRAQENLTVTESGSSWDFITFYENNLTSKNRYSMDLCRQIIDNSLIRDVGRMLYACDPRGDVKAAVFCVWDAKREYYFMSTRSADANSGAISLLIWSAIQHASSKGLIFDMDGVHVVGNTLPNLHLVTGFGGALKPRWTVRKSSPVAQICYDVGKMLTNDWSQRRGRTVPRPRNASSQAFLTSKMNTRRTTGRHVRAAAPPGAIG
jgi:hypothetical protein